MTIELGAQTHFGQGWNVGLLDAAEEIGVNRIRDSIAWNLIEKSKGVYSFDAGKAAWLDTALAEGVDVTLVFAHNNTFYDGGKSVYTDAGRAAFANFVVAMLERYPNVSTIEIGNEYNASNFVSGVVGDATKAQRAVYYAELIKAVGTALDKAGLDVEVLGGATHSIPVDYFEILKDEGALQYMDAVSIHPYTTRPEQFEEQISVLRKVIGDDMPIRVTEFGHDFDSLDEAPAYLAKMLSVMGAAGIASASWYALATQKSFTNMELWNPATGETPAGASVKFFEGLLADADTVSKIELNDFTYMYAFGEHAAVLWGESGDVKLAAGVTAYDLLGNVIDHFDGRLSADTPIVLRSAGTISAASITYDNDGLVGDSFDQFDVTNDAGGTAGFEGPWSYFAESDAGKVVALYTMGGGLKGGEQWTPYLGTNSLRPLQVSAESVTPVDFGKNVDPKSKFATVERYTVQKDGTYDLRGHFDVDDATSDGVTLHVRVNGKEVFVRDIYDVKNGHVFDLDLENIDLKAGDTVDFVIGSHGDPKNDTTERHIQIFEDTKAGQPAVDQPPPSGGDAVRNDGDVATSVLPETGAPEPAKAVLDLSGQHAGVQLNLKTMILTGDERVRLTDHVDSVTGTDFDDRLLGDDTANEFHGGGGDDKLTGNGGNDFLYGGAGDDRLDGGEGADVMDGGAGSDTYVVDHIGDVVIDTGPAGDTDIVESTIDYTLGDSIERLYLKGAGDIDGFGNALDNLIKGNDGANTLSGGGGADKLYGGAGADVFLFDAVDGAGRYDQILDFTLHEDHIALSHDAFGMLRANADGTLVSNQFAYDKAATADQHLIYNSRNGMLYYDADGSGAGEAVAIAKLSQAPSLHASDILLV